MELSLKKIDDKEEKNYLSQGAYTVVTSIVEYQGKILALQRARKDAQFGLWGIPGGKLDKNETTVAGLSRELWEETKIKSSFEDFCYLDKAISQNPCDKTYVLYLYYLKLDALPNVEINTDEHLDYKWVTVDEFEKLNLLLSQGKAFDLVKNQVIKLLNRDVALV